MDAALAALVWIAVAILWLVAACVAVLLAMLILRGVYVAIRAVRTRRGGPRGERIL